MSTIAQCVDDTIWGKQREVYEERVIFVDLVIEQLGGTMVLKYKNNGDSSGSLPTMTA